MRGLRHGGVLVGRLGRDEDLAHARLLLTRARADRAELVAAELRRSLVSTESVRADLRRIRDTVSRELNALVDALPDKLAGLEPGEMSLVVGAATDATLRHLADAGAYLRADDGA